MGDTMNGLDIEGLGNLVEGLKANPHMAKSIWYASSEWKGGFACDINSRNFNWKIDEPNDLGGTDVAANPVEMFLGSLCACLTIGYSLNATMMGVEISKLKVEAEGDIDIPGFVGLADAPGFEDQAKTPGYQKIRVNVKLKSNATPEQLQQIHKNVLATSPVGLSVANPVGLDVQIETRRMV